MPVNSIDTDKQVIGNFLALQAAVYKSQYRYFTRRENARIIIGRQYAALASARIDDFGFFLTIMA